MGQGEAASRKGFFSPFKLVEMSMFKYNTVQNDRVSKHTLLLCLTNTTRRTEDDG